MSGDQGGGPPRRRMPPPDHTGREADWLAEHREKQTPVVAHLEGGETVRGVIEYYDRDMVKIDRTDAPGLFIRKRTIRYIEEAD